MSLGVCECTYTVGCSILYAHMSKLSLDTRAVYPWQHGALHRLIYPASNNCPVMQTQNSATRLTAVFTLQGLI